MNEFCAFNEMCEFYEIYEIYAFNEIYEFYAINASLEELKVKNVKLKIIEL